MFARIARTLMAVLVALALGVSFVAAQDDEERITIRFWHIFGNVTWITEVLEPAFEAEFPQYDLEPRVLDNYNAVVDLYNLAQEQGDAPELALIFEAGTQEVRDSGFFKPLFEAIDGREEINGLSMDFSDIFGPIAAYYSLEDGQFYSMPWNTSTPLIYANMDLLVEAGLASDIDDVDAIPETWAEVEAACAAITESTEADCINWSFSPWYFEQSLAQQGQTIVNNGNGRDARATETEINSQAAIDYLTYWQGLAENGFFVSYDSGDAFTAAFANGELAFSISSSASARSRKTVGEENGFTVRAGRHPYNQDVDYVGNLIGGATIYLTDGLEPEVEEGALTFLAYLVTPENAADWHFSTGYVPVNQRGADFLLGTEGSPVEQFCVEVADPRPACEFAQQGWDPDFQVALEQFAASTLTPASAGGLSGTFLGMREILSDAFEEIIINGADIQETMDRAKAEADLQLEEYNLLVVGE